MVKRGFCCPADIEKVRKVKEAGYDYAEVAVVFLMELSDEDFEVFAKEFKEIWGSAYSHAGLFPGTVPVAGPEFNKEKITAYLEKALGRVQTLGGKFVVFGSGGSRKIPEGFSREEGMEQIEWAAREAGRVAETKGITIVMEELRKEECNTLNSITETYAFVKKVNHPAVKLLADYYHMVQAGEGMDELVKFADEIRHMHFAEPVNRTVPNVKDDFDYKEFFALLDKIGYTGGVSVEARVNDFDNEVKEGIKVYA